MITVDTQEFEKSLREFQKIFERKIKNMVAGFAYEVTLNASRNTPVGDQEKLDTEEGLYYEFYVRRERRFGIDIEVGYHAGSWQYSETGSYSFSPIIFTEEETAGYAKADAKSQYKIGQVFYIVSAGPGSKFLEDGKSPKAPNGILQPTLADIEQTYQIDLQRYYNEG